MRMSCLTLALATIFVVLIVHAPKVQAKALSDADADADADAIANALADPGIGSFFKALGRSILKLFKKAAPTIAAEVAIQAGTKIAEAQANKGQ